MKSQQRSAEVNDGTGADGANLLAHRPWLRRLIGAAVLWHLTAVAIAPWAVLVRGFRERTEPPGGGPPRPAVHADAVEGVRDAPVRRELPLLQVANLFQPYLDLLYLNHGYSFFAPEPGPSYVMDYEVRRPDRVRVRGRLPNLERHWPRLLYHRYFMLTTQNPGLMAEAEARGRVESGSTDTLAHAIAAHLNQIHDGEVTILRLLIHRLLWPEETLSGKSTTAEDTYAIVGEIRFPPADSTIENWQAEGQLEDVPAAEEAQP